MPRPAPRAAPWSAAAVAPCRHLWPPLCAQSRAGRRHQSRTDPVACATPGRSRWHEQPAPASYTRQQPDAALQGYGFYVCNCAARAAQSTAMLTVLIRTLLLSLALASCALAAAPGTVTATATPGASP